MCARTILTAQYPGTPQCTELENKVNNLTLPCNGQWPAERVASRTVGVVRFRLMIPAYRMSFARSLRCVGVTLGKSRRAAPHTNVAEPATVSSGDK